jgi:hypothetical protein
MAAFLTLSVLDLCLTGYLLGARGDSFYEANPVAAGVLKRCGWWGLGGYKLACAGTVLGIAAFLGRRRPRVARRLLAVACPVVAVVVSYSLFLVAGNWTESNEMAQAREQARVLELVFSEQNEYLARVHQYGEEIATGRLTLGEATEALKGTIARLQHFQPWRTLRLLYQGLSDEACLTAHLVREVGFALESAPQRGNPLAHLEEEFVRLCGRPLPPAARQTYYPVYLPEPPLSTTGRPS